jgi:hypothetical protein
MRRAALGVMLGLAAGLVADSPRSGAFAGLQDPVGARSLGLGNALAAVAEDPQALWSNPAGLSRLDEHGDQVYMSGAWLGQDRLDNALAYAHRFDGQGSLGLGLRQQGVGGIEAYDSQGDLLGIQRSQDLTLLLCWASEVSYQFRYGLTLKGYQRQLPDQQALGGGFDLGLSFTPALGSYATLALVLQDAGGWLQWSGGRLERPDPLLTLGLADRYFSGHLLVSVQAGMAVADEPSLAGRLGLEWRLHDSFAFRAGLDQGAPGAGFSWQVWYYTFEYGFLWDPDGLGHQQVGSLLFKF